FSVMRGLRSTDISIGPDFRRHWLQLMRSPIPEIARTAIDHVSRAYFDSETVDINTEVFNALYSQLSSHHDLALHGIEYLVLRSLQRPINQRIDLFSLEVALTQVQDHPEGSRFRALLDTFRPDGAGGGH